MYSRAYSALLAVGAGISVPSLNRNVKDLSEFTLTDSTVALHKFSSHSVRISPVFFSSSRNLRIFSLRADCARIASQGYARISKSTGRWILIRLNNWYFRIFFNLFRVEDILSDKKCCNYCSIFIYRLFFTKCISWDIILS